MKHFKFSRLFAALLFISVFLFASCQQNVSKGNIYGFWVESGSWGNSYYEISPYEVKNYGDTFDSYSGNSVYVIQFSDTNGTIFIKYTKSMNPDNSYSETAPDVGKWYAINYKDLTINTVKLSGAYKASGKTSCATLDEAIQEFTIDNGYFAAYSSCQKR